MRNRFVPYGKLSKKARRMIDSSRRRVWGPLDSATRRSEDPKVYNRARTKRKHRHGMEAEL